MNCIKPVAKVVGFAVASAAAAVLTVVSGGTALPAAGSAAAALAPIATSSAVTITGAMIAGGAAGTASGLGAKRLLAEEFAQTLGEHLAATDHGSWWGQYAGPEWPFRCDQKPSYVITGGWGRAGIDKDGNFSIEKGVPLRLSKTNGCGNAMMAFTKDLVSSPALPPVAVAPPQVLPSSAALPPAQSVVLTNAAIVGNYVHTPPPNAGYAQNDWHIGSIVQDANGLHWINKAGSVWKLTPDLPNFKLHTGPDNPYFKTNPDIDVVVSNGQLLGLRINGAPYVRTK